MKMFGFHASSRGGKKMFAIALIMALLSASLSAFSVLAAPSQRTAEEQIWGSRLRELDADRAFFDHFKAQHSNFVTPSHPRELQQYLNQYAFALKQAEAIVKGRGTTMVTGQSTNT